MLKVKKFQSISEEGTGSLNVKQMLREIRLVDSSLEGEQRPNMHKVFGWFFKVDTVDKYPERCCFLISVPWGVNEDILRRNFKQQELPQPRLILFN